MAFYGNEDIKLIDDLAGCEGYARKVGMIIVDYYSAEINKQLKKHKAVDWLEKIVKSLDYDVFVSTYEIVLPIFDEYFDLSIDPALVMGDYIKIYAKEDGYDESVINFLIDSLKKYYKSN